MDSATSSIPCGGRGRYFLDSIDRTAQRLSGVVGGSALCGKLSLRNFSSPTELTLLVTNLPYEERLRSKRSIRLQRLLTDEEG